MQYPKLYNTLLRFRRIMRSNLYKYCMIYGAFIPNVMQYPDGLNKIF